MALTKVTGQVINDTTGLVVGVTTVGGGVSAVDGFFSGIITATGPVSISTNLTVGGSLSVGGTITYEDVTNVDSVGIITARSDVLVGSGITLSPDGDIFFTGIITGNGSGLTNLSTDLVNDTSPQLGGDLASNGHDLKFADASGYDGNQIYMGSDNDVRIHHDGSNFSIAEATGDVTIQSADDIFLKPQGGEDGIKVIGDGAVELYHNNSKKLETASGGVTVTGTVAATSYTGDGSSLTGISVGIATTAASMTGITTVLDLSKDDFKVTASGITTVDVRGGTEGDSHTLRIVNSGITTVGFSTYFLFPSGGTPNLPITDGAISLISFTVHRQGAVGLATQLLAGSSVNFS